MERVAGRLADSSRGEPVSPARGHERAEPLSIAQAKCASRRVRVTTRSLHGGAGLAGIGRIGPNAILQGLVALTDAVGEPAARALMAHAGLLSHVDVPPTTMVDERDVQALHLHAAPRTGRGARACHRPPRRAADRRLPAGAPHPRHRRAPCCRGCRQRWASRALMLAIRQHAWTFCGSGLFAVLPAARGEAAARVDQQHRHRARHAGRRAACATILQPPSSACSRCWCTRPPRCAKSPARRWARRSASSRSPGGAEARPQVHIGGLNEAAPALCWPT
jgi:bacteriochlorophyll 4-vinyl reductase